MVEFRGLLIPTVAACLLGVASVGVLATSVRDGHLAGSRATPTSVTEPAVAESTVAEPTAPPDPAGAPSPAPPDVVIRALVAPEPVHLILDRNPGRLANGSTFTITMVDASDGHVIERRTARVNRPPKTASTTAAAGAGSFERGPVSPGSRG